MLAIYNLALFLYIPHCNQIEILIVIFLICNYILEVDKIKNYKSSIVLQHDYMAQINRNNVFLPRIFASNLRFAYAFSIRTTRQLSHILVNILLFLFCNTVTSLI